MNRYDTLVLSGGSIRTICELGSIQYYLENDLLSIDTVVTSSASSIIAYLMIIGYNPIDMLNIVCSHPLLTTELPMIDMIAVFERQGGMSFSPIRDLLESLTIEKIGRLVTLGKLQELFGVKLVISSFNYDKRTTEYFSPDRHPDLACISAIQMSCAIPFIFPMYKYMGDRYIDPCIEESIPLGYLKEMDLDARKVLAIVLEPYLYKDPEGSSELYPYFHNVISFPTRKLLTLQMDVFSDKIDFVHLQVDTHFLDYNINTKEKFDMFIFGFQKAQSCCQEDQEDDDIPEHLDTEASVEVENPEVE